METTKKFQRSKIIYTLMTILLFLPISSFGIEQAGAQTHNFKMISTIEYSGQGQYRSQAESVSIVSREGLDGDMVRYNIRSTNSGTPGQEGPADNLSYIIDTKTRRLLSESGEMSLLENINNQCVKSFRKLTKEDIGKSWERSFKLSVPGTHLPGELKFNLKAIGLKTDSQGKMIAVRAMSEPFFLNISTNKKKPQTIKCDIGAVYLFDTEVENIYLSVSVFEATTKFHGYDEKFRNEVATYMTDSSGAPVNLGGIGKEFEQLVRKLGLSREELKVTKKVTLPGWIQTDILKTAQACGICAATACEGALNPVITVCAVSARTIELQLAGKLITSGSLLTVSKALVQTVPGIGTMKIAMAPALLGGGIGTVGTIAGGTAGAIAAASGSSSSESRSPSE